jgi:hypothetical protein|tara:strand:+ start:376 stop:708 length:333 start_codon:yes stop_codon:yes gene_type:complete
MAIKANIVIDQGTDFSALIDVETATDAVFNLTGYTVAAQMRKTYASATGIDFGCSHNGVLGQISITLSSVITDALSPGRYLYDIEITSAGGSKSRVVQGTATVTAGITRT